MNDDELKEKTSTKLKQQEGEEMLTLRLKLAKTISTLKKLHNKKNWRFNEYSFMWNGPGDPREIIERTLNDMGVNIGEKS